MIISSERKSPTERKIRPAALQPSTAAAWIKDQLAVPRILTREERRAKAKKDSGFHGRIRDLWED